MHEVRRMLIVLIWWRYLTIEKAANFERNKQRDRSYTMNEINGIVYVLKGPLGILNNHRWRRGLWRE